MGLSARAQAASRETFLRWSLVGWSTGTRMVAVDVVMSMVASPRAALATIQLRPLGRAQRNSCWGASIVRVQLSTEFNECEP
jgi:hypothetical protein